MPLLPRFESKPEEIRAHGEEILSQSKARTAAIALVNPESCSFDELLGAMDFLEFEEALVIDRFYLLQNVSPSEEIRKAAQEMILKFQDWAIEKAYHRGLYRAVKKFAERKLSLPPEDSKLLLDTLDEYRRLGLELPEAQQSRLKDLQKKLSAIETEFSTEINDYEDFVEVTREGLLGLDEEFILHLPKTAEGRFKISLQYPEYLPVMEFCSVESTRKSLIIKKYNTARERNVERLNQMIALRDEIAELLGFESYNHYIISDRMAKTPEKVRSFLTAFEKRLTMQGEKELSLLRDLKRSDTQDPTAEIHIWDYLYYASLFKRKHFQVDLKALKEFFPLSHVLNEMLAVMGELFSIKFLERPSGSFPTWHPEVQLFEVKNLDGSLVGFFYLDLFPRAGKYGHAAQFNLVGARALDEKTYQAPVGVMVCNFSKTEPSLLSHSDVETLFHEFGHLLHSILTTAKYYSLAGTHVAWDFVEAPSQVLENWCWDYEILNRIARHTKDPSQKISRDFVEKMNKAHKAGVGMQYLRQVSFAKADLEFHQKGRAKDSTEIMNRIMKETFLPLPQNTTFQAGWGHMVGYAAGYYGYAWADVMAADIFGFFKRQGLLNRDLGLKLRQEIYEPGSSRDELVSLERFLGRPLSDEAFFENLGV